MLDLPRNTGVGSAWGGSKSRLKRWNNILAFGQPKKELVKCVKDSECLVPGDVNTNSSGRKNRWYKNGSPRGGKWGGRSNGNGASHRKTRG